MKKSFTFSYLKNYSGRAIVYLLFVVCSVLFTIATALSVSDFLKILFETPESADTLPGVSLEGSLLTQALHQLYAWLISFGQLRALIYFSLLVFVLYTFKNVFTYLSALQISIIRSKVVRDIRNQLFRKAMSLPVSYYSTNRKGDMLARFGNDIVEYEEGTLNSIQQLVVAIVSMLLYLAMLFYISTRLTLFVLCMLPIIVFVISGISRKLRHKSAQVQQRNSFLTSLMEETIMGLKVIKAYTAIDFSNQRFQKCDKEYARLRTNMHRRIDAASPISDFMGNAVVIGILLFGSSLVLSGDKGLTPELFVSYIMMFVLMIPPSKELTTAISMMKKGRACIDRLQDFLNVEDHVAQRLDAIPFSKLQQHIQFHDVCFSYQSGTEVLHDVSFTIPRGATVALVGSSGSGKSTLADLLLRFYDCTSGSILIDGVPITDLNLEQYRSRIGVVSQDTLLFNDTIRNNIVFGYPDATDEQIMQAAQIANAHQFITEQSQGYETNIGDGGECLSGGQRQRISIARAVLRNPDILILDEATSALDTESEQQVQRALENVMKGRSALVIAHRLSTVQHADKILVLEQGRIIQQGTHQELIAQEGRYRQLVELQSFLSQ